MSIRIIEQSPDHSAQNPPPENEVGEPQGAGGRQVVVVDLTTPDGESHVFRGKAVGCVDDLTFSVSEAPAVADAPAVAPAAELPLVDTYQPVSLANCVEVPSLSWVLRPGVGTYRIGTGEDRLVFKLPPRWALEPLAPKLNAKTSEAK